MKKGLLSRAFLYIKFLGKGAVRYLLTFIAGKKSYRLFGVPRGCATADSFAKKISLLDEGSYPPPFTIEGEVDERFSLEWAPKRSVGLYTLTKGIATTKGGQLTSSGRLITTYLQNSKEKYGGFFYLSKKRFFPKIVKSEEVVATLCTSWQSAFYHWMHEVLPRLAIYKEANIFYDKLFVECKSGFQKESLDLLGIPATAILNAKGVEAVQAPTLIASSIPERPTSWSCHFLRESFLPHLSKSSNYPKRIYLSRRDAQKRRILNEEALLPLLHSYGFTTVVLSEHSLQEQMNYFYNAEAIVAPHGAGLSHLFMAEPKTKLLEFFAKEYVIPCYWHLANVCKIEYHYLFSEEHKDPNPEDPDLLLDLEKVEKAIRNFYDTPLCR